MILGWDNLAVFAGTDVVPAQEPTLRVDVRLNPVTPYPVIVDLTGLTAENAVAMDVMLS